MAMGVQPIHLETLGDLVAHAHKGAAERMAAVLPGVSSIAAAGSRRPARGFMYSNGTAAPVVIKSLDEVLD
jgi:hypothetical protein